METKKKFDWYFELNVPVKEITVDNIQKMRGLAASWTTCACGNLCDKIPRAMTRIGQLKGEPLDFKLRKLGEKFSYEIDDLAASLIGENFDAANHFRIAALELLDQIEKRSAEILSEIE